MQDRVKVLVGDNDDQWEVRFSREVHRTLGVNVFSVPCITVEVDRSTGALSLGGWCRPGSTEEAGERSLFETCRDDIVEALLLRGVAIAGTVAEPAMAAGYR